MYQIGIAILAQSKVPQVSDCATESTKFFWAKHCIKPFSLLVVVVRFLENNQKQP